MTTDFDRADKQHRPPLGVVQTSTGPPLIVTPTFVSRVDDTAHAARPHDPAPAWSRGAPP